MEIAIILLCLLAILYANNHYEHFYNPISFFCIIWLIVVSLAAMRLMGLNETSQKAYGIVFIGIFSFIIGSSIGIKKKVVFRNSGGKNNYGHVSEYKFEKVFRLNTRIIWAFTIVTLIVLLTQASSVMILYLQGASMHDIRIIYASGNYALESGNAVLSILNSYVAKPFEIAVMPLSAIAFLRKGRRKWGLFISCIVIIILQIIVEAGRVGIVQWLFCFAFIYFFSYQQIFCGRISTKVKLRIIMIAILCFIVLVYLSSLREIENINSSFYTYICGCMPYMDIRLETVDSSGILTYGASALFGLTTIVAWLLSVIGIYPPFFTTVTNMSSVQEFYFIGDKIEFNAFVTTFYHLYIDGRWIGVIIGMLVYGYFCGRCYDNVIKNANAKTIYIYTLVLMGLLFSMIRFPLVRTNYALALCFVPLFFKKYFRRSNS